MATITKSAPVRWRTVSICGGADLVLELPAVWATASAEYFAAGGVQLLGKTGVVDTLCYGCETPEKERWRTVSI